MHENTAIQTDISIVRIEVRSLYGQDQIAF